MPSFVITSKARYPGKTIDAMLCDPSAVGYPDQRSGVAHGRQTAPGELIPWHSHSEIADHFFVLDGELTVETRAPDDYRTLGIGQRYQINAGHAHQTSNRGIRDCRFLIVQGVGRYDFLRSPL